VAVALVMLIPLWLRWQAQWHLNAYRKKLIASGEKLTVEEFAPKRKSQATNTALFLKLGATLPSFGDLSPSAMQPIKPGVARVAWRQLQCLEKTDEKKPAIDVWPAIRDAVRTNEATLGKLQGLLNAGGIEFIQDYSQPDLVFDSHLVTAKELVRAFIATSVLALHQGQTQEAFEDLKSSGTISQLFANDPLMIDQLVRYACMVIAASVFWEALQAGGWTDEQLAQLQHQWDGLAILADAGSSLAMERARAPMGFQQARTAQEAKPEIWNDFLLNTRTGARELLTEYPRYWGWRWIWSYQDEQHYLEFMQTMIEATREAQKRHSFLALLKDQNAGGFLTQMIAPNFDLLGSEIGITESFVSQALRAQTVANLVTTAIALERYRLTHHAYPAALANLAPEFVQAVPVDCMDGHDLRYRLNPDGTYLLYSVGEDGVDNGGDPTPEKEKRLYFLNGRDWVWPRPATDEEVQAYEAEQNKPKAVPKRP
jgi:hypothetical protein